MNRITPGDVGRRVSVRRRLTPGGVPPQYGDVVGELTAWSDGTLTITRKDGTLTRVAEDTLVAGKVVPPVPVRGPAAVSVPELQAANDRAWPAVEYAPLGRWWLRAASGFTRRANSVLPLGEPGIPFDEAVARARAWYAERGLPTYVQTVVGSPADAWLAAAGWTDDAETIVQTARLAAVRDRVRTGSVAGPVAGSVAGPVAGSEFADRVEISDTPDAVWLSRYNRVTLSGPAAEAARAVLAGTGRGVDTGTGRGAGTGDDSTAPVGAGAGTSGGVNRVGRVRCAFATVREPGLDVPIAIGRVAVDLGGATGPGGAGLRVASFTAIETDPAYRRRGLARAVMAALTDHALREGATTALLGVEADNDPARALYANLGFSEHHRYQYRREP